MPNLDFYSIHEDHEAVLRRVFDNGGFRVFELSSKTNCEIVEFTDLEHLKTHFAFCQWNEAPVLLLQLLPVEARGTPNFNRIDYEPGVAGGARYCYKCQGWGLIQLYLVGPEE